MNLRNERLVSLDKQITRPWLFIEVQSKLIQLEKFVRALQLTPRTAFTNLMTNSRLFLSINTNEFSTQFFFPHEKEDRIITIQGLLDDHDDHQLNFFYLDKKFLNLKCNLQDQIQVTRSNAKGIKNLWSVKDIQILIDLVQQVLRTTNVRIVSRELKLTPQILEPANPSQVIDSDYIKAFADQYANYSIQFKINNTILKYANRHTDKYEFDFKWLDASNQSHNLKAIFSNYDNFYYPSGVNPGYSWFVNEDVLLQSFKPYSNYHVKNNQKYCSLKLFEEADSTNRFAKQQINVLTMWFTSDGLFGELNNIKKGRHLSGNDAVAVYLAFDHLFQVKNTFINDVSAINSDNNTVSIPLRLIAALATDKTWYQSKIPGLKLFECANFPTAANDTINQNALKRENALKELQKLPVYQWYQMLEIEEQRSLIDIYNRNIENVFPALDSAQRLKTRANAQIDKHFDKNITIKALAVKIYNESKLQKSVTYDLIVLTCLLTGELDRLEKVTNLTGKDAWVKTRVNEVLANSTFWVKRTSDEPLLVESQKPLLI